MRTRYITILVLAMAAAMLSATALPCLAAEDVNEDNIWAEDAANWQQERFELTDERIEHIMSRLTQTDPNKAEELKQLQAKDPEKFKTELKEVMKEKFGKRSGKRMQERSEHRMENRGMLPGPDNMPPPGPAGAEGMPMPGGNRPFGHGRMLPGMGGPDEYLKWLKENYAEEAEKLAELSEKDPNLYRKQFGLSLKKYGRIAEAARENPQLAEVLKKDLELRLQQDNLLGEIEAAGDKDKEELVNGLKEVINSRFDVIVERKQIEYEQLLQKLDGLKDEVEARKGKIEKWKDTKFKAESVEARLKELLDKNEKFRW
ncbi:MAG: hypothetical protein PHY02_04935 [Phycisphaerae bacterium]|nr:hypothetical protein [Phycisphaerae bacterium]